jgi:hypothetical protein
MIIRDYNPKTDKSRVYRLWKKQGFKYAFPDLNQMIELKVIEVDEKIVLAVGARPTVELYGWIDNDWETPGMRRNLIDRIYEPMRKALFARGIQDAHAFMPPEVCKPFGRRMAKKFHWIKSTWDCYVGFTGR